MRHHQHLTLLERENIAETLTYMDFPEEHWKKIRTNNTIERLNRRNSPSDSRDWDISRWKKRPHARLCSASPRRKHTMGS